MKKNNKGNRWQVFQENNPTMHICVMIIAVNVVFILLSAALICILPENEGKSLGEILRLAFTLMVNPSGKYIYSETPISLIITTVVVLLGMISLTGGTVGFITSFINGFLERAANNKRTLKLTNHIVILNYNNKVPSIIYDYCFDDVKNTYIVILANEDKQKILDEIDNMYDQKGGRKRFKNIIVRDGNPMSKIDLDKIALKNAQTVLLMMPGFNMEKGETITADKSFEVSKLFMFVAWYFSQSDNDYKANIVVEANDAKLEKMVREYHLENNDQTAVAVNYNEITGKMLAITALMPSVNGVMKQLFSFEGVEVYIQESDSALSVEEELAVSHSVIPVFVQGSERVYIAEDEEEFEKTTEKFVLKKKLPEKQIIPRVTFMKTEIIVVGTNSKLPYILESLQCFKNEYQNHKLHVILAGTNDEEETLKGYYGNPFYQDILMPEKYSYIIVDDIYSPMKALGDLAANKADSIIFLSDDMVSNVHIDEKPLIYWTKLKESIYTNKQTDVIVEILDSQNQSIIELRNKDQIIVSDDFLGHLYAQLGKNPARLYIIKDMITSEGDSSTLDENDETQNAGDIICANVKEFFKDTKEDLTFTSKKELILWVYEATNHEALPIGLVKDGVPYIFARVDDPDSALDSTVLLGIKEGQVYDGDKEAIRLEDEDELVMFMVG